MSGSRGIMPGANVCECDRPTKDTAKCLGDSLANRVVFYMDDAVLCDSLDHKRPYVFLLDTSQPSAEVFGRRTHNRAITRRRDGSLKRENSLELRRETSVKRLSEVPSRKRSSIRRSYSVRESSKCERENCVTGGSFRSQRCRTGSQRRVNTERQNSVRSGCNGSPRRCARKVSTLSERFELPHKDLPAKERRRRTVVLIVICTFLFLVACSVLVVIVTLTNSTFHRHPLSEKQSSDPLVRKENEQLMNLNRDDLDDLYNSSLTTPSPTGLSTPPD